MGLAFCRGDAALAYLVFRFCARLGYYLGVGVGSVQDPSLLSPPLIFCCSNGWSPRLMMPQVIAKMAMHLGAPHGVSDNRRQWPPEHSRIVHLHEREPARSPFLPCTTHDVRAASRGSALAPGWPPRATLCPPAACAGTAAGGPPPPAPGPSGTLSASCGTRASSSEPSSSSCRNSMVALYPLM